MANEFIHASVGTSMTQAEFEAVGLHVCNSQATGDLIYASSATQVTRLGVGTNGDFLTLTAGIPAWTSNKATSLYIGDTANTGVTLGLTINQGAADDGILSFKSSDVAHGATTFAETDTYGLFMKGSAGSGGLNIRSLTDTGTTVCFGVNAYNYDNASTTKSTAGRSIIEFVGSQISGTGIADVVADGNVFGVRARVGDATVTNLILDEDGDLWLNGSLTLGGGTPAATGVICGAKYIEVTEMAAPGVGAANTARIYAIVDGGALTDLAAVFQDGTVDIFAQESTPLDSPIFTQPSQTEFKMVMEKPHPGLIKLVAKYPDGKTFTIKELQYHDADKVAANVGCVSSELPIDWEVTTAEERLAKTEELEKLKAQAEASK